jgi:hypothetical protein
MPFKSGGGFGVAAHLQAAIPQSPPALSLWNDGRLGCRLAKKRLCFDALLRLPEAAYERRTGQPLPRAPKYIWETGFNVEGWGLNQEVLTEKPYLRS